MISFSFIGKLDDGSGDGIAGKSVQLQQVTNVNPVLIIQTVIIQLREKSSCRYGSKEMALQIDEQTRVMDGHCFLEKNIEGSWGSLSLLHSLQVAKTMILVRIAATGTSISLSIPAMKRFEELIEHLRLEASDEYAVHAFQA